MVRQYRNISARAVSQVRDLWRALWRCRPLLRSRTLYYSLHGSISIHSYVVGGLGVRADAEVDTRRA